MVLGSNPTVCDCKSEYDKNLFFVFLLNNIALLSIYLVNVFILFYFSGIEKNLLKKKKKKIKIKIFFFSSTELKPELLMTECTMQKSAIKLSHKVAQSTSIFIDKYRFNSILRKKFRGFRMQGAF